MTILIEFKRCGLRIYKHNKRDYKRFPLDRHFAFELEFIYVYVLIYCGSLLKDIKNKFMGVVK